MKTEANLWPLEGEQGFEQIWPSDFLSNMIHIQTWPRYHQDKNSDVV